MTDQEWREYYDQACVSAGKVAAPETRITLHVILQMLAHLKHQTENKQSG